MPNHREAHEPTTAPPAAPPARLFWARLRECGARAATLDLAVQCETLAEFWARADRPGAVVDLARASGLELEELFAALYGVLLEGVSRDVARLVLNEADVRFDDHGELKSATWNGTRYADAATLATAYLEAHRYFTAEPRPPAADDAAPPTTEEQTMTTKNTKNDAAKNFDEMSPEELATIGLQKYNDAKDAKRKAQRAPKNLSPEELAARGLKGALGGR